MKKYMKKNWIIIVALVVVIAGIVTLVMRSRQSYHPDDYDEAILILNETDPVDIYIYEEKIPFREELKITYVSNLDSFFKENHNSKTILLISDMNSSVTMTEQTISSIINKINNNSNFDFYYLGSQYMDTLIEKNIFYGRVFENEFCLCNVSVRGVRSNFTGIWTASDIAQTNDNKETMAYLLVRQFVRVLKENY